MNADSLLRLIERYAEGRGLTVSTVSTYAAGAGDMHGRLSRGHDITTRRAARIAQWLSNHWPPGVDWPADIPRPDPQQDREAA